MLYRKKYRNIKINISCDIEDADCVNKIIDSNFKNITKFEKKIGSDNEFVIKLTVTTRKNLVTINNIFKETPYINKIEVQEISD